MKTLSKRQQQIMSLATFPSEGFSSSQIVKALKNDDTLVTVRRAIQGLVNMGYLAQTGKGRSVVYHKTDKGLLMAPFDVKAYQTIDLDNRGGKTGFNFSIFNSMKEDLFTDDEIKILEESTNNYHNKVREVTLSIQRREMERFIIEMSWKSSKIEGNTYTLLDTERLIREGVVAPGHTKDEATMILNHKKAFSFIIEQRENIRLKGVNHHLVEKIHELLSVDLGIDRGVRKSAVGVTGSIYRPLETPYQIREAMDELYTVVNSASTVYQKALIILVGISYIQAFADANKRTARLLANALLIAVDCAPLSYRNIDEVIYREAILIFYEKNSIVPMKEIFIDQYLFSTEQYLLKINKTDEEGGVVEAILKAVQEPTLSGDITTYIDKK